MKKIWMKSAIFAMASFAMTSCADFLNIEPLHLVVEDNYWNEKNDVDQIVAGCYTRMQDDDFMKRLIAWGEMRSDNITIGFNVGTGSSEYNILIENILSTNGYTDWSPFYSVIDRCNLVIDRAPKVAEKDPTYVQSDVLATIAEMSALRAICYFYLVRTFKNVPFYTYPITADEQQMDLPATDGDVIIDNLIADLENVRTNALRAYENEKANYGRITQDAISAILADMCLWRGYYDKAILYSDYVIESKKQYFKNNYPSNYNVNGYPLIPSVNNIGTESQAYNAIFGAGGSAESIFELDFEDENNGTKGNNMVSSFYYNYNGNTTAGLLAPSQDLLAEFRAASIFLDKTGAGNGLPTGDSRLTESVLPDDFKNASSVTIAKYVYTSAPLYASDVTPANYVVFGRSTKNSANWIFYRVSEMMLIKAEAMVNKVTQDGSENLTQENDSLLKAAFELVRTVNDRSNIDYENNNEQSSALQYQNYASKADMFTLILEERRREFMFEGKRWYDLVRMAKREGNTKNLIQLVSSKYTNNAAAATAKLSNMDALYYPYNYDELRVNGNLQQNPAYGAEEDSYENN